MFFRQTHTMGVRVTLTAMWFRIRTITLFICHDQCRSVHSLLLLFGTVACVRACVRPHVRMYEGAC